MNTATIAEEIRTFIRDQILFGQDDGLSATTPLFELGILDSFAIFQLVAHLNQVFPIDLGLDQIAGRDFQTIESIAAVVARRLPAASASPEPTKERAVPDGAYVFEAPACAQVFIMFTGRGGLEASERNLSAAAKELAENAPEFFKKAGLGNRNVILIHDVRAQGYGNEVSSGASERAQIVDWLSLWIGARPHIDEIYCLGVSAGGPTAMLAGDALRAKTVWAFAPRTARATIDAEPREELVRLLQHVTGKTVKALLEDMTQRDREMIDAHLTPEIVEAYYGSLLHPDKLIDAQHLANVVHTLEKGNGVTRHRVYYVPRDACDSMMAESLGKCFGVTAVRLQPSDEPPAVWPFSRWFHSSAWICRDHLVVDLLRERGVFASLFPEFRAAAHSGVHTPDALTPTPADPCL